MRVSAAVLIILSCATGSAQVLAQPAAPVVVELFTSQGCSSCPPADALLNTYASRPGIMALSFAVDYWDHLGWKDTLASAKNTARQRSYAKSLGTGNVYTPQVVVNGEYQAVGSKKSEIEKAIALAGQNRSGISLTASSDGKRVAIEVGASAKAVSSTVWLAIVLPETQVEVKRGENRGKTLAYHNVVRDISPIGMWGGSPMKVELPRSAVMQTGDRCAVFLQAVDSGRILAASWMTP